MHHVILLIAQYLSDPSSLYLIDRMWYNALISIRGDILRTLMSLYPQADTCRDAWRYAILHMKMDIIKDTISIIPFTPSMYSWWVQMLDMIDMAHLIEMHVPYGLSVRSTRSLPRGLNVETMHPSMLTTYHIKDMIENVNTHASPPYRDMVLSILEDIPTNNTTCNHQHYAIWVSITDAYRLSRGISCEHGRGRILQSNISSCTLSPYYLYERYRDHTVDTIPLYDLERVGDSPSAALLFMHMDHISIMRYMILSSRISIMYCPKLQRLMIDRGINPLWYMHLFYTGTRPADLPDGMYLSAILTILEASSMRIDLNMRILDRLLAIGNRDLTTEDKAMIYNRLPMGSLRDHINTVFRHI